jgi:hypothetical protein
MRRPLTLIRILLVAFGLTLLPVVAGAKAPQRETAAEHLALAKKYKEKAAQYRQEAAEQRSMAETYKESVPGPAKGGAENPWAKKMQTHYDTIAADADKLAADADEAAEFHTLRAKELQGK